MRKLLPLFALLMVVVNLCASVNVYASSLKEFPDNNVLYFSSIEEMEQFLQDQSKGNTLAPRSYCTSPDGYHYYKYVSTWYHVIEYPDNSKPTEIYEYETWKCMYCGEENIVYKGRK